ncbi:MAG: DUF512 domain-containing protein [Butyricicoccaceae bacterium]
MASKITAVDAHSPAERYGIRAGETLVSIDGQAIRDVLDYKFYGYDADLELLIRDEQGGERTLHIRKREGQDLGLSFETYLMDKPKHCANKCVFCFIDQLPKGMRDTLYFKDDDARLSFLMGNYISMTNLSDADVDRMIKMRISPVNVSVQVTDPECRRLMLNNRRADRLLPLMHRFADAHIEMNCQLVICPGLNDGELLRKSLEDLEEMYPAVNSISVVPVGLSAHREGLYPLRPVTREDAREIIAITEQFAERCYEKWGTHLAFCGDELYIKAELPLPETEYYEEFTQFENGIGMIPLFMEEFMLALPDYEGRSARPFSIATGEAAAPFMRKLLDAAKDKCDNLNGSVYTIQNNFFGGEITVAGLITGQDLIAQLKGKALGERVLISENMLRDGGDVFLDDYTPEQVAAEIGVPVVPVHIDGADLLAKIFEDSWMRSSADGRIWE